MNIKRLRELAGNNKKIITWYHASDKQSIQSILSHGFNARNDSIWFNTDPNLGVAEDEGYIVSATLSIESPWHYGDTSENFDPDDHQDILHMIKLGYDAWIGPSNIGNGDDIVVFNSHQIK